MIGTRMYPDCKNWLHWDRFQQRFMHHYIDDCAYQETINGERTWDNVKCDAIKRDHTSIIKGLIEGFRQKEQMQREEKLRQIQEDNFHNKLQGERHER